MLEDNFNAKVNRYKSQSQDNQDGYIEITF